MNEKKEHIDIRRTRLRLVGVVYGITALAVFTGAYFLAGQLSDGWSTALRITGGVTGIFLAITGASAVQLLGRKDAGLWIDKEGITDNSTLISSGFVPWKSIRAVEPDPENGMIRVMVKHPETFFKQAKNRAVRQLLERNHQLYRTPVVIESKYLAAGFDDLVSKVMEFKRT